RPRKTSWWKHACLTIRARRSWSPAISSTSMGGSSAFRSSMRCYGRACEGGGMPQSYVLENDGTVIRCLLCHHRSTHPTDVQEHYCGRCHVFHDQAVWVLGMFAQSARTVFRQIQKCPP